MEGEAAPWRNIWSTRRRQADSVRGKGPELSQEEKVEGISIPDIHSCLIAKLENHRPILRRKRGDLFHRQRSGKNACINQGAETPSTGREREESEKEGPGAKMHVLPGHA